MTLRPRGIKEAYKPGQKAEVISVLIVAGPLSLPKIQARAKVPHSSLWNIVTELVSEGQIEEVPELQSLSRARRPIRTYRATSYAEGWAEEWAGLAGNVVLAARELGQILKLSAPTKTKAEVGLKQYMYWYSVLVSRVHLSKLLAKGRVKPLPDPDLERVLSETVLEELEGVLDIFLSKLKPDSDAYTDALVSAYPKVHVWVKKGTKPNLDPVKSEGFANAAEEADRLIDAAFRE